MLNWETGVVFAVIVFLIVFLYMEYLRTGVTFLISVVVLVVAGVITPKESLAGFANEQLAVIVLLLVISSIFKKTGVIDTIFRKVFQQKDGSAKFLAKMTTSVGFSSAFLNNTPIVAMLMPYVNSWCKENQRSVSRFLIPLSYASILGGCATLIGTSTNLIVNGIAVENGEKGLAIFDFAWAGLPMLIIGILYLLLTYNRLLPEKDNPMEELVGPERHYFLEAHVGAGSSLAGKTVEEGGLRNLGEVYLVEILREGKFVRPVSPKEILEEGDVLFFAGNTDAISEFPKPSTGLSLPQACNIPLQEKNDVVEVIISQNSKLAGKRVRDTDFRAKYDGAILAIHRNGEQLRGRIGEVELRSGDVLMVLGGKDFAKRVENNPAFYVLSRAKEIHNVDHTKVAVLIIGLLGAIGLAVAGLVPLFISLVVLLSLTLLLGIANPTEIRNGIDFHLILIIALGLALGKAMVNSGAAEIVADTVIRFAKPFGAVGLLAGIFLVTNLLASFMTSKAAVAIILPVALTVSHNLGVSSVPFILIVAYGGAANFITPIGYQTNLMVYGPGGYSFRDFMRIGLPLTLIYLVVSSLVLGYVYDLF